MFDTIHPHLWMLVPTEERHILAEAFQLPRTGTTEVRDHEVISDGYSAADLSNLSRERMAEYVGEKPDTDLSIPRLWELTVSKARSIAHPPVATITDTEVIISDGTEPVTSKTPKNGKKGKASKA